LARKEERPRAQERIGRRRKGEEGRRKGSELSPTMTEGKRRRERIGEESIFVAALD